MWLTLPSGRLGCTAFRNVLDRKQSGYRDILRWLDDAIARSKPKVGVDAVRLGRVARAGAGLIRRSKY